MNMNAAFRYLVAALEHCANACARTREMVKRAIARYVDKAAAWTEAAQVLARIA